MGRKLGFLQLDRTSLNFGEGALFRVDCGEGVLKGGQTQLPLHNISFLCLFSKVTFGIVSGLIFGTSRFFRGIFLSEEVAFCTYWLQFPKREKMKSV